MSRSRFSLASRSLAGLGLVAAAMMSGCGAGGGGEASAGTAEDPIVIGIVSSGEAY